MLSETLQELLSAYVDGELAPTEYERVMSALRDSAIARDYVAQLRGLSQQLKSMPAETAPAEVTTRFLQNARRKQLRLRHRRLAYAGSIAAALFLGLGSWWYVSQQPHVDGPVLNMNNMAHNTIKNDKPIVIIPDTVPLKPKLDPVLLAQLAQEVLADAYDRLDAWQDRLTGTVAWLTRAEAIREGKFRENQSTLLTGPIKSTGAVFKTLDAPLPLLQTPADYNLADLQNRWSKKGLFVLDVSSKDTVKTLSRLLEAGHQTKLPIVIDDEIKQRLAKKLPTTFMLYLQNLTEEQAAGLVKSLSVNDYWAAAEARSDVSTQSLLLYLLDASAKTQVARSLGVTPEQFNKAETKTAGLALSYYSYRLPTSLGDQARKLTSTLQGPSPDKLSFVVLIRAGK